MISRHDDEYRRDLKITTMYRIGQRTKYRANIEEQQAPITTRLGELAHWLVWKGAKEPVTKARIGRQAALPQRLGLARVWLASRVARIIRACVCWRCDDDFGK